MIDFTEPVASSGDTDARAFAATNKNNAPSAIARNFNFICALVREKILQLYSVGPFLNSLRSSSSPSDGLRRQLSASHRFVTVSDSATPPASTAQVRLLIVVWLKIRPQLRQVKASREPPPGAIDSIVRTFQSCVLHGVRPSSRISTPD